MIMKKRLIFFFLTLTGCQAYSQAVLKTMLRLPDTGETTKYTSTFGEDADYTINPPGYIDNHDGTVTDTVTGLMWQKTDGGEMTVQNAEQYPDTLTLGGYTDWRLPNAHELFSLQNLQHVNPALDPVFTVTNAQYWWSSEKQLTDTNYTWCANAGGGIGNKPDGETVSAGGTFQYHIRAVRNVNPPVLIQKHFVDNGDGTITDSLTNLIWQKAPYSDTLTWENALTYADTLSFASDTDWRLPNIKELESISIESHVQPSLDTIFHITNPLAHYWASTSLPNQTTKGWYLDTHYGITTYDYKTSRLYVLCVRSNKPRLSTGIRDVNSTQRIEIYPNPFTNKIYLNPTEKNEYCELLNSLGQIVYSGADIQAQDLAYLPGGVYFLKVSGKQVAQYKLIKQ
jgi:Protein of unknown function (DUF1566)/Secretion system C-terminal sorting domain